MGEMPKHWPPEFAKRAKENLDLICKNGKNDVTQTVLTLYALVVVPDEHDVLESITDLDREQMLNADWPVQDWCWAYKDQRKGSARVEEDGMKALLRMLRNALAHGHLEFESSNNAITAIKFRHERGQNTIDGKWSNRDALIAYQKVLELIERASAAASSSPSPIRSGS